MGRSVAVFVEGGDGVGKTTQVEIWAKFLREAFKLEVVTVSLPVYETFVGATIGRCLGRWGDFQAVPLPDPETMARLYAQNREEIMGPIKELIRQNYHLFFNRGPLSNIYNVARQVLADGVNWNELGDWQKQFRFWAILRHDREFLKMFKDGGVKIKNIYLALEETQAKRLIEERASTLGGEPDRYEAHRELQVLTRQIYEDVCGGRIEGVSAKLIATDSGSTGRLLQYEGEAWGREELEKHGILFTAAFLARELDEVFGSSREELLQEFKNRGDDLIEWHKDLKLLGQEPEFDFRLRLGLPLDMGLGFSEGRLETLKEIFAGESGLIKTLEASAGIERGLMIRRERELG